MAVSFLTDMLLCERLADFSSGYCPRAIDMAVCLYTAFIAGPIGTTLAAAFTHKQFQGVEHVPYSTVEPLAYVAKCPQLYVDIGAVFSQTLSEWHFSHRSQNLCCFSSDLMLRSEHCHRCLCQGDCIFAHD